MLCLRDELGSVQGLHSIPVPNFDGMERRYLVLVHFSHFLDFSHFLGRPQWPVRNVAHFPGASLFGIEPILQSFCPKKTSTCVTCLDFPGLNGYLTTWGFSSWVQKKNQTGGSIFRCHFGMLFCSLEPGSREHVLFGISHVCDQGIVSQLKQEIVCSNTI